MERTLSFKKLSFACGRGRERQLKTSIPFQSPKRRSLLLSHWGTLGPPVPEAQARRGAHLSKNFLLLPRKPPSTARPQVCVRVAESNPVLELPPGCGDPAADAWHRPTPSPRSPTFSGRRASRRPTPRRWSRGRACHIFLSGGRSGARHALPQSRQLERRPGARAPDARGSAAPARLRRAASRRRPGAPASRLRGSGSLGARQRRRPARSCAQPAPRASLFPAAALGSRPPRRGRAEPRPQALPPPRPPPASPPGPAHLAGGHRPREVPVGSPRPRPRCPAAAAQGLHAEPRS